MAVPVIEQVVTGTHLPTTNYANDFATSSNLTANGDELYLLFVAMRDGSDWGADAVSGGGLTWARLFHHKQLQVTLTHDIWWAYGTPSGDFAPTVNGFAIQSGAADTSLAGCHLTALRISGADSGGPVNGISADCGATDTSTPNIDLTVGSANSLALSALVTRNFTISSLDADYAEVAGSALNNGSGGNILKSWVHENGNPATGTEAIDHTLNAAADWIISAIEVPEGVSATNLEWLPAVVAYTGGTHTALNVQSVPAPTVAWTGGSPTQRSNQVAPAPTVAWTGGSHTLSQVASWVSAAVAWTGGTPVLRTLQDWASAAVSWTGNAPALSSILSASAGLTTWTGGTHDYTSGNTYPWESATATWTGGAPTLASIMAASTGAVAWTQPQVTLMSALQAAVASVSWVQPAIVVAEAAGQAIVEWLYRRRRRRFDD